MAIAVTLTSVLLTSESSLQNSYDIFPSKRQGPWLPHVFFIQQPTNIIKWLFSSEYDFWILVPLILKPKSLQWLIRPHWYELLFLLDPVFLILCVNLTLVPFHTLVKKYQIWVFSYTIKLVFRTLPSSLFISSILLRLYANFTYLLLIILSIYLHKGLLLYSRNLMARNSDPFLFEQGPLSLSSFICCVRPANWIKPMGKITVSNCIIINTKHTSCLLCVCSSKYSLFVKNKFALSRHFILCGGLFSFFASQNLFLNTFNLVGNIFF